ncbi:MAG: TRAP transporter substrate-binding protein [Betaproteobacteria bacterium]
MLSRCCVVILATTLMGASVGAEEITLRVHHHESATSVAHVRFLVPWCDRLAKASSGRLKCRVAAAMQMGGTPPELVEQARVGSVDVAWTAIGFTPGRFGRTEVFELPFMIGSPTGAAGALWEFAQGPAADEFRDVRLLAIHPRSMAVLHNSRRPIRTLADVKGLRLRAPTRLSRDALTALGAMPVGMPAGQAAEMIGQGMLDGALLAFEDAPGTGILENTRYHTETGRGQPGFGAAVAVLVMNRRSYDRLPADLRKVIDGNSGAALSADAAGTFAAADAAVRQKVPAASVQAIAEPELGKFREAVRPVVDNWVRGVSRNGVNGTALLETARKLLGKHRS